METCGQGFRQSVSMAHFRRGPLRNAKDVVKALSGMIRSHQQLRTGNSYEG
jgi:hypothetical protein